MIKTNQIARGIKQHGRFKLDLEFPIGENPLYSHDTIDYNQDLSRFKNNL